MRVDRVQPSENGGNNKSQVGAILRVKFYKEAHDPTLTAILALVTSRDTDALLAGVRFTDDIAAMASTGITLGQQYTNGLPTPLPAYVYLRYLVDATGSYRLYFTELRSSGTGYVQEIRALRVSVPGDSEAQCVADCCARHPLAK